MNKMQKQQARLNKIVMSDSFGPTAVVLEGRDTAGKSSTIRELTHYLPVSKFSAVSYTHLTLPTICSV